ncbi:GAF domain-containing protein [Euzebya rosea]|uniref:GAF domain-containing protein n=1 Tax=Euzebya rosea TaxID=2052804 RepID=UPI000D3ED8B5|nr:GAF domain-containing protein [Euzebya rosea]
MPRTRVDPVLTAIVEAATRGTGASHGLLLRIEGRVMRVAASAGALGWDVVGEPISAGEGVAGYVAASGQPLVLSAESADPRLGEGTASLLGHNPSSVLAVPVDGDSRIVGVLELIDPDDGLFDVADTEQAMLHAAVASAALTDDRLGALADVPEPAELAAELRRLADADPGRYATVATIIEALVR